MNVMTTEILEESADHTAETHPCRSVTRPWRG